jgi:hypothetical protein
MPDVISRAQWGARPPKSGIAALAYPVAEVFLHHEAGPVWTSVDIDTEKAKMRSLQAETMAREYADFPYGVAVFPSGRIYEGRDLGFIDHGQTLQEGATIGENARSIAIVWIGNYEQQGPTAQQVASTAYIIQLAQLANNVTVGCRILGHRDAPQASTACPGTFGEAALPEIRRQVSAPPPPEVLQKMGYSIAATPTGNGYWISNSEGAVFPFGDAKRFGQAKDSHPAHPIVGIAAHPLDQGYWQVGADGGIFGYGAAQFEGSMGGKSLSAPVTGMTVHPSGKGYWLVGADGALYGFGAAKFFGHP